MMKHTQENIVGKLLLLLSGMFSVFLCILQGSVMSMKTHHFEHFE